MTTPARGTLRRLLPFALAYGLFLMALSVDIILLSDDGLLAEGPPIFDIVYLIRSTLVALSSGMLVFGIAWGWPGNNGPGNTEKPKDSEAGRGWGDFTEDVFSEKTSSIILWGLILLSSSFLILFLIDAGAFYRLGKEDNLIEFGSALAWFCAAVVFFRSTTYVYRVKGTVRSLYLLVALSLAVACFLVSMEEVSWFQRVFSYKTPDLAGGNLQDEFNLHNFATDQVENIYYFGIFLFLIVLPFFVRTIFRPSSTELISTFLPGRLALMAGALAMAYNYDMWNILFTQLSFFTTIFILVVYAWRVWRAGGLPVTLLALIGTLGWTQFLFLINGSRFIRLWDVTEYKEFFIPLGVVLYSMEVLHRIGAFKASGVPSERAESPLMFQHRASTPPSTSIAIPETGGGVTRPRESQNHARTLHLAPQTTSERPDRIQD